MYKLFTDKSELFECDIKLEGASLSKSSARLVVETSDYSLLFKGNINSKGKCEIPSKKVTVEVKSQQTKKPIVETKVKVNVKNEKPTTTEKQHVINLFKLLIKENINVSNISFKRNKLNNIVATYLQENTIKNTGKVINGVLKILEKEK